MKVLEFLNDDTCQILLAIIVGIVICYFIFGSCSTGSCGKGDCSRKEGFSVGAPFNYGGSPNPDLCQLAIAGHFSDSDLFTCDPSDVSTASVQCCTGGSGGRDDFQSLIERDYVVDNCSTQILTQLREYEQACNESQAEPVEPVDPEPSACISGDTYNADPNNPGVDPGCTPCNQCTGTDEYGIKVNCTPTTNSVCNSLEDIVINRNISIAQDMRRMLLQLMVGDSADKTELNSMSMDPDDIEVTLQSILAMSSSYDLHFIVLQNTLATTLTREVQATDLENFEHPKDALYLFNRTSGGELPVNPDHTLRIKTKLNKGMLWGHQAASIILYDRFKKWH